jgi:hypothetical protein
MNRVKNRVPGLDADLPPAYDTLGNEKETYQNKGNSLLNVLFNPSFVSKYNPSKEAKFILDYINETGDNTVAPRLAKKKIDGTKLTGEQFAELQKLMGKETKKGLEELIPKLQNNEDKAAVGKEIYNLLNAASKKAKASLREKLVTKEQLAEAEKLGIDEETVLHRIQVQGWTIGRAISKPIE